MQEDTLQKLKSYRDRLIRIVKGEETDGIENQDRPHNALVVSIFFANCHQVKMYCGEMSLFRNSFYDHIEQDYDKGVREYVEHEMATSLNAFLSNTRHTLHIYIQNPAKISLDSLHPDWKGLFTQALKEERVKLFSVDGEKILKDYLYHFSMGNYTGPSTRENEVMMRLETDEEEHNAKCLFHTPRFISKRGDSTFLNIHKAAAPLQLS